MECMSPDVALLVSSFERAGHLERALASVAVQEQVDDQVEVVVTDDGSGDETIAVVSRFAAAVPFSVKLTTHQHAAFQLARCRNEGVLVSTAPYLLFSDGDCVFPRDHIAQHLRRRQPRTVMAGDCCRLPEDVSAWIDVAAVEQGDFQRWAPRSERRRLRNQFRKACFYNWIGHRTKPKLIGNNIGMWRADYVAVNGFDEEFIGWGCEDDDLRLRVRRHGIRVESILKWTCTYHLWHPPEPSCPPSWWEGPNVSYYHTNDQRPTRCHKGLIDLAAGAELWRRHPRGGPPSFSVRPFAEVVFHPGEGRFSGHAAWNVLVVADRDILPLSRAAEADRIVDRAGAAAFLAQFCAADAAGPTCVAPAEAAVRAA